MHSGYMCLWEFTVPSQSQAEFERHYGSEGTWVQLFRMAPGFVDTLLLKDRSADGRYVTVDRWESERAYLAFRKDFALPYAQLDQECARLTAAERLLGAFTPCGG